MTSDESSNAGDDNMYENGNDNTSTEDVPPKEFWIAVVSIAIIAAPSLSFLALNIMKKNPIGLIKCSLWFSVVLCGLSAVIFLAIAPFVGVIYGVITVCLICYARSVQSRIPYAASNLKAGITVLKTNLGLGLVAIGAVVGLIGYSASWAYGFGGVMQLDSMKDTSESLSSSSTDQTDLSPLGGFVGFLFILSFYWTHQVLQNVARATVSGVVGTWWFSPIEASSFCSSAVSSSFYRSTTYSFGSICFGSLIVALLHMLRDSLRKARNDRNGGILSCIALCILSYIEALVEYMNKWAYVYVGLYGYDYIEGGRRVIGLFKTRGWQLIIADNLVNRLLGIMSLSVALLTGMSTLFAAFLIEEVESKDSSWIGIGFVVGFFIGMILSGIFFGLLSSAVDSIIVCYAEAPKELEESHPDVAQEMSQTWADAWGSDLTGPVFISLGGGLGVV